MSTVTSFSPPADVHCARLAWRGKKKGKIKRAEGLPGVAATLAASGVGGTVADGFSSFFLCVFFFLRCLFFFHFLSFSSRLLSSLLSSLSSVLSLSRSLGLSLFSFFFPFPCFYRQEQGRETWLGRPLCCCPSTAPSTSGNWVVSASFWSHRGEGSRCETEEKRKSSSSPVLCVSRGRRWWCCFQNSTVSSFLLFFFGEQYMKRRRFTQNAPFHINGNWRQKRVRFKIRPSLYARCALWSFVSDFFN